MSVIAVAEKGNLLNAPETYMDKIVTGNHIPTGSLDIDFTVKKNINIYSEITKKKIQRLQFVFLKDLDTKKL